MSQVTNLLNRAITLATEAATGTVAGNQRTALNDEFTQIKAEIDRIGSNTTFNGQTKFSGPPERCRYQQLVGDRRRNQRPPHWRGRYLHIQDTNTGKSFTFTAVAKHDRDIDRLHSNRGKSHRRQSGRQCLRAYHGHLEITVTTTRDHSILVSRNINRDRRDWRGPGRRWIGLRVPLRRWHRAAELEYQHQGNVRFLPRRGRLATAGTDGNQLIRSPSPGCTHRNHRAIVTSHRPPRQHRRRHQPPAERQNVITNQVQNLPPQKMAFVPPTLRRKLQT